MISGSGPVSTPKDAGPNIENYDTYDADDRDEKDKTTKLALL